MNLSPKQQNFSVEKLQWKSIQYRKRLLDIVRRANAGHTGGDLSCLDILNVLYNYVMSVNPSDFSNPDRDRYIQSKGHSVEALYTVLEDRGFFTSDELNTINQFNSDFIGHPTIKINGIEHNTGALGHGLAVSVGIALAGKLDHRDYRVFTLLGDGELEEGSNWEASMSASQFNLDNLVVIIDRNKLQITGPTESISKLEPLQAKFKAFGYAVRQINGNDIKELTEIFDTLPFEKNKPNLILAQTIKGKGISFIENQATWHHHVPNDEELAIAMAELNSAEILWEKRYVSK